MECLHSHPILHARLPAHLAMFLAPPDLPGSPAWQTTPGAACKAPVSVSVRCVPAGSCLLLAFVVLQRLAAPGTTGWTNLCWSVPASNRQCVQDLPLINATNATIIGSQQHAGTCLHVHASTCACGVFYEGKLLPVPSREGVGLCAASVALSKGFRLPFCLLAPTW